MIRSISQKGGALLTYLTFGLISAGVTGYYVAQGKVIDQNSEKVALLSQQVEQIQTAQMSCFGELRRWCTPGEIGGFLPGNLNTLNGAITFNQVGDDLRFTVNTSSNREASVLSNMLVAGSNTATVVNSTIRPPTDAQVFNERLQRYTNATDANRTVMGTSLDMGGNRIDNIGNLTVENITSDTLIARELETERTIVNSELDIGGNRIVSNSGDIDIFSNRVITQNDLAVVGDLSLQNTDANNVDGITATQGNIDNINTVSINGDSADIDTLITTDTSAINSDISSADIDDLDTQVLSGVNFSGRELNVDDLKISNQLVADNFNANNATIDDVNATNVDSNSATIDTLLSKNLTTQDAEVLSFLAAEGDIQNLDVDSISFNSVTVSNFVADVATLRNLTVNNTLDVQEKTVVNTSTDARYFDGQARVEIDNASIADGRFRNAYVTEIDIDDNNATLTNFRVSDLDVNRANAASASIVNVWVDNNLNADEIIANLATTQLLDVQTADIANADINSLFISNASMDNLYAKNFTSSGNANFDTMSADGVSANYADIGEFNVNNLTVRKITGDFISEEFSGDSFYASGDYFSSNSSVNSNANNLETLYESLDKCINVTGYCLEKEPDFVVQCIGCTKSGPFMSFTSTIQVEVKECLQGCSLSFDLDGMDNISGCSTQNFAPGYTGTYSCSVGASVPTATTLTFNPVITMANSRRTEFTSSSTTTVKYTNTLARNPQFAIECSDCSQAKTSSSFTSNIKVTIDQCVEGCTLSFNIGALSGNANCNTQTFAPGYTGSVTCRVSRTVADGDTFTDTVDATLSNDIFGDSSSLSVGISYENTTVTDNPPQFTLTCSGCSQAKTGGSFTVELEVEVLNCDQGCSVNWDVSDFDSSSFACGPRTISAGTTPTFICSLTEFVPEGSTFTSLPEVTLENLQTNQQVTESKSVTLENKPAPVTSSDIEDSIADYTYQIRTTRHQGFSDFNDPVVTRNSSDREIREGAFFDPSLGDDAATTRVSITNINFKNGSVCDSSGCEVSFNSVVETAPSGSFVPRVSAQIYACSNKGATGSEIYYAQFKSDTSQSNSAICEVRANLDITHIDSGEVYNLDVSLRPLVSY